MASLYEITADTLAMIEEMEAAGLSEETIHDTVEANQDEFETKVSAIVGHIKNMKADVEAFKAESKRLSEEAKKIEKKQQFWTDYLDTNMKALNIKQLKDGVHELKYRKGLEVVNIAYDQTLPYFVDPSLYEVQEPKFLGKAALKARLQAGEVIPGVTIERNPDTLQIK